MKTFQRYLTESTTVLDHPDVVRFLAKFPSYRAGFETFAAKYGDAKTLNAFLDYAENLVGYKATAGATAPVSNAIKMEFWTVMDTARKGTRKAQLAAKKTEASAKLPALLQQLKDKYGLEPGMRVHDSATGQGGVVKIGRNDGQPYVLTDLGQQVLVGSRWSKK